MCGTGIGHDAMTLHGNNNSVYDTKDQEKDKNQRVTDEGWNSQKQLSGPVEKKRRRILLYPHLKLSLGLVPYT